MPLRIVEAAPERRAKGVRVVEAAPAPAPKAKPKTGALDYLTGLMANVNRGLGVGDELAAAGNTALSTIQGAVGAGPQVIDLAGGTRTPTLDGLKQIKAEFDRQMGRQRGVEDNFAQEHPKAAAFAKGSGMGATALIPAGAITKGPAALQALQGAGTAALSAGTYALSDRGAMPDRAKAAGEAMTNPVTLAFGAGLAALPTLAASRKAAKASAPLTPQQRNVKILEDKRVFMTPGAKGGAFAKNAEDIARRAPILGPAVKGAAGRSVESLNRAVADEALSPVGLYLPKDVATGHDAVAHVAKTLGGAYDEAAAMVPKAMLDEPFDQAIGSIASRLDEQPAGVKAQFQSIIANRLEQLRGKPATGAQIREAQSQIGKLAADFSASDDGAQRALGGALDDLSDELANIIGRNSPEAAALIDRANTGWSVYTRIRNAASKAKGGIFSPGQLATAVRTLDRSVGKGNVAKRQAVLQDLSNAAWEVLPDSFGNPGTADALSAMSLAGAVVTPVTAPVAIPTALALTGAATPYFFAGRKVVERIPGTATRAQLREADRQLAALMTKDPAVAALRRQVAARLAAATGVAAAGAAQPAGAKPPAKSEQPQPK